MDLYLYNQLNFLLLVYYFHPMSKSPVISFDPSNFRYLASASDIYVVSDITYNLNFCIRHLLSDHLKPNYLLKQIFLNM